MVTFRVTNLNRLERQKPCQTAAHGRSDVSRLNVFQNYFTRSVKANPVKQITSAAKKIRFR